MSYADFTPSRSGQNNDAGHDRKLFEKKMSTDVLHYFQTTNVFKQLITVQTIPNGKSKSFPIIGNSSAEYHVIGEDLQGNSIKATERTINIDAMLVAHTYIAELDEAMVHYDARSAYNESLGRSLAKRYDEDAARMIAIAGMISNSTEAQAHGLLPFADDIYTSPRAMLVSGDEKRGNKIFELIAAALSDFREKDVIGDLVCVLKPEQYFALLNNSANHGLTWVNDPYRISGQVPAVLGIPVLMSPHIPSQNDLANTNIMSKYRADFSKVIGLLFTKESVGALELIGLNIRTDYVPVKIADLAVAKMAVGFGILNHACAITLLKEGSPTTRASVTTVTTPKDNTATGNDFVISVEFDENVVVSGKPKLKLLIDGRERFAEYDSGSGTDTLVFKYEVVAEDDGELQDIKNVILKNGGTIKSDSSGVEVYYGLVDSSAQWSSNTFNV